MKTTVKAAVLATTLLASLSGVALANPSMVGLTSAQESTILQLVPGADLSMLTVSQVGQLNVLLGKSENLRSGESPANKIRVILNNAS